MVWCARYGEEGPRWKRRQERHASAGVCIVGSRNVSVGGSGDKPLPLLFERRSSSHFLRPALPPPVLVPHLLPFIVVVKGSCLSLTRILGTRYTDELQVELRLAVVAKQETARQKSGFEIAMKRRQEGRRGSSGCGTTRTDVNYCRRKVSLWQSWAPASSFESSAPLLRIPAGARL